MAGLAVAVALAPVAFPPQSPAGVVVDAVGKGGAAARAGLRPGDVLMSWRRNGNGEGSLDRVFDVAALEYDDAGRGATTFIVARGRRRLTVSLPGGQWRLEVRPSLAVPRLVRHQEALRLARDGDHAGAGEAWRALAQEGAADAAETCWLLARAGDAFLRAGRPEDAKAAFALARAQASATDERLVPALWDAEGNAHDRALRHGDAIRAYREALALHAAAGRPQSVARLHRRLGRIAFARDDWAGASEQYERCLAVEQQSAPRSLDAADALFMLGWIAERQGDSAEAEARFQRALETARSAAPESVLFAEILRGLGALAASRGDMTTAEALYLQGIPIYEARGHRSGAAAVLQSLGNIFREHRGDLEGATDLYRRALALAEAESSRGSAIASTLNSLGIMALLRGDLREAEETHRRSMAVSSQENPEGLGVATSLHNLGRVAEARGDWPGAEDLYRRSLAMKTAPIQC